MIQTILKVKLTYYENASVLLAAVGRRDLHVHKHELAGKEGGHHQAIS